MNHYLNCVGTLEFFQILLSRPEYLTSKTLRSLIKETTEKDGDICVSDKSGSVLKFKTLREKDENGEWSEFNYPDFETKEGMDRLRDRCKMTNNLEWDAIQPYCEYLDAN